MYIYTTNFKEHGKPATDAVNQMLPLFDKRKKAFADEELNRRVLAGFLATRRLGAFEVSMAAIPESEKATVKAATAALAGEYLTREPGKNVWQFREEAVGFGTQVKSAEGSLPAQIETVGGAIFTAPDFHSVPFEKLRRFGYCKPAKVEIVNPHAHWNIFSGYTDAPAVRWFELTDDVLSLEHDSVMNLIVEQALKRGVQGVRYGESAFLTGHPEAWVKHLSTNLMRYYGKPGIMPLLVMTDQWGRQHTLPGTMPAAARRSPDLSRGAA